MSLNIVGMLCAFVNQRSGIDFNNYGDVKAFRSEQREITKDRSTFYELLERARARYGDELGAALEKELRRNSGRLTLNDDNKLEYCTGQYFPTEYRPAASRILVSLLWNHYRDEKDYKTGEPVYKDGNEIRKAISRELRSRDAKAYFK